MPTFAAADAAHLHDAEEIRITPLSDDGTAWLGRLVWVVVIDGRVFVRSWKGGDAEWYVRAVSTLRALVAIEEDASGFVAEVTLHPDQDEATAAAIDAEFLRKYPAPYAAEMTQPTAAVTTVELRPV